MEAGVGQPPHIVAVADPGLGHPDHMAGQARPTRTARWVSTSKVTRSRWLTPMTSAPAARATSASASSCTSTRASRPRLAAVPSSSPSSAGAQGGDDQEHGVGAHEPGVAHIGGADGEVLAQDRQLHRRTGFGQVVGGTAEKLGVGQYRQAGGPAAGVSLGQQRRLEVGGQQRPSKGCGA